MEINPIALQFIYDETLFHFNEEIQISSKNKDFLGENKSHVSIFSHKKLDKDEIELLKKILLALKLSFEDIALIESKANSEEYYKILSIVRPKKIILFGLTPFEIGLKEVTLNKYEILEDFKNMDILQGDPFSNYHNDPSKKKALWLSLQRLITK